MSGTRRSMMGAGWAWLLVPGVLVAGTARSDDTDCADTDAACMDTDAVPLIDSDDDGIPDAVDPSPFRCDGDFDGIRDSVELGMTAEWPGLEGAGCFRADADPTTTTDPSDPDSDRGGRDDGDEDWNFNGRVDPWEGDPNQAGDDLDSDDDRIPDAIEGMDDPDGDGVPNALDPDSDGDGREDRVEWLWDRDGDGVPAFLDDDSDDDTIPDSVETGDDPDRDGWSAWNDSDADGDGVPDGEDGLDDLDGDDRPGYLDTDQDGDGEPDGVEWGQDLDCDGVMDARDRDEEDGFCHDAGEGTVDGAPFDDPLTAPQPADPAAIREAVGACATAPGSAGWLALLGVLAWRRRAARIR